MPAHVCGGGGFLWLWGEVSESSEHKEGKTRGKKKERKGSSLCDTWVCVTAVGKIVRRGSSSAHIHKQRGRAAGD